MPCQRTFSIQISKSLNSIGESDDFRWTNECTEEKTMESFEIQLIEDKFTNPMDRREERDIYL